MDDSSTAVSYKRVAAVTVGLCATGAVCGALCGVTSVALIAVPHFGFSALIGAGSAQIMGLAAIFGGAVGALGAPLLGWGVLQRVPLGRAVGFTGAGTVVGAVLGEALTELSSSLKDVPGPILGGLIGFIVAGVALRVALMWGTRRTNGI